MTTVDFYKDKIAEMKTQFDQELFADQRQFVESVDETDGDTTVWKTFKVPTRKD